ncbi:hypothetical protein NQ314_004875 [Rhamnusium bicolor]|uniref:ATP synthase F0 subunit 8 n=1 Tax=Rhamnusium bicolor TaxID=1586634 RepID=A0AAV8ZLB8_9CUCU|nr:hypothetical protein NQ314_004875 [Rhamnusium bicolor]
MIELSLSFVTAIYSLFLAILLLFLLLQQLILVSIGMTLREWRNLPLTSKLCLGLTANRPHSQGFLRNWSATICWTRNNYAILQ